MKALAPKFVCHGCGAVVDMALHLPFACPRAAPGDDIDHVLAPEDEAGFQPDPRSPADPFLRYRALLSPYRLARAAGLSEDAWAEFVGELDEALIEVDGTGFRITPMTKESSLVQAAGLAVDLWVKDETGNVAGSHKARHLMGVVLYLRVLAAGRLSAGEGLRERRLAIASCGNAALAAAVIARAAEWPIDVFIPPDAPVSVVRRLKDLGATIAVCTRRAGETGDPCVGAFRHAVQKGAIPFGVQGPDNGLAIEGGRTLAFEMADALRGEDITPAAVFVQVGGGALASAVSQGFAVAAANSIIAQRPRLVTVQTEGCAPLARAWRQSAGIELSALAHRRSQAMWPWEATPASIAHGIIDDETYDWWDVIKGMRETGGAPVVVGEDPLARAWELARTHTEVGVSATGSAGFAGLLQAGSESGRVIVIFSGAER